MRTRGRYAARFDAMYAPLRLLYSLRPHAPTGLLLGALASGFMFSLSPFSIPDVAQQFGIGIGSAGVLSAVQVGGFGLMNLVAGRLLVPSVRHLRTGIFVLFAMDVSSALVPAFPPLVVFRAAAGLGAGLITWVAWSDSVGEKRRFADVAAIGPIGAIIGAPLLGGLVQVGGFRAAYAALAGFSALILLFPQHLVAAPVRKARRVSPSRSNRVLLVALTLFTLAGSSLFIYAAGIADEHFGLGPLAVSFAFSLNAAGGVVATRMELPRVPTSIWFLAIVLSILAVSIDVNALVFYLGMALWGFAFWMALPRVLRMLAERSLSPDERVGDAQAGMAFGRALGPLVGAPLATAGAFLGLGVLAAAGMVLTAIMVGGVEIFRRGRREPSVASLHWRF